MAWNYRLLTGFEREEGLVFDLTSTGACFIEAFHSCHPSLSLVELARLHARLKNIKGLLDGEAERLRFFEKYQLRYQESLVKIFEKIDACPAPFQNWVCEKGLGPRELEVLNAACIADLKPLLEAWPQWGFSRTEGAQALEWAVELFLMGAPWEKILSQTGPAKEAHAYLKALRFPETSARDEKRSFGLRSLPWPSQIQAQWNRHGDQAGIEIRFRVSSLTDFHRKLKGLGQVEEALSQPQSPLQWKN
jgi:hypothetical protein